MPMSTQWDEYFGYLCSVVGADDPDSSYIRLMKVLFSVPFIAHLEMDMNRVMDGLQMRRDYQDAEMMDDRDGYFDSDVTVLEVLIALAERINDELDWNPYRDQTVVWFWEMLANLGLDGLDDESWKDPDSTLLAGDIIDIWVDRRYDRDGFGGIFPLRNPSNDQRDVEIWYQANAYFLENRHVRDDFEM